MTLTALNKWYPPATSASACVVWVMATREAGAMGDEVGRTILGAIAIAAATTAWRWTPRRGRHAAPHRWPSPSMAIVLAAWITVGVVAALAVGVVTWVSEANRCAHQ